jgi:ATP synthase protein I
LSDGRRSDGDELGRRIAAAKSARASADRAHARAEGRGWAIGIEFVGTVLVATAIGWALDKYAGLHTRPFAMIVMLVIGFAAGTRRAMQTSEQFDNTPGNDPVAKG